MVSVAVRREAIIEAIFANDGPTCKEIVVLTKIPKSSLVKILRGLVDDGIVCVIGHRSGNGAPAPRYGPQSVEVGVVEINTPPVDFVLCALLGINTGGIDTFRQA